MARFGSALSSLRLLQADSASEAEVTFAERAAEVIERSIVTGELSPGERLGVHELASRFGIGATPIREGLSRLVYRGFVVALGKRGFRVADVSEPDLRDIVEARLSLEVDALRNSMIRGGDAWEAGIVAALHRMKLVAQLGPKEFVARVDEFDARHKEFHMALIGACGSSRVLEFCSLLFDQAYRYRRVMFSKPHFPGRGIHLEHEKLARLALSRDQKAACALYVKHLNITPNALYPLRAARAE